MIRVPVITQEINASEMETMVEGVLEQIIPVMEEDSHFVADMFVQDFRNHQNLEGRNVLIRRFLEGLDINGHNQENVQITETRVIPLRGFGLRFFQICGLFSASTIAYLIMHLTDGGSGCVEFLKMLIRTLRCLLLAGIPIRSFLDIRIRDLRTYIIHGLNTLMLYVQNIGNVVLTVIERPINNQVLQEIQEETARQHVELHENNQLLAQEKFRIVEAADINQTVNKVHQMG